jgi:broad specificity phosphatase PhoE
MRARCLPGAAVVLLTGVGAAVALRAGTETPCERTTTLLVVRHADRRGEDDALSDAGRERALALARTLARSGVAAVYHSDTDRTRLTAAPLAGALGITPVELPAKDVSGLVAHVFGHHCGETVLIVGHSNTVPLIVAAAGGPSVPDLAEDEFDDLFVVTVRARAATLVRLEYGAESPAE